MKSADGAPLDTTAFGACMARVESEVALVVDDVLAADIADGKMDAADARRLKVLEAIDAAHALVPGLPKVPGKAYVSWLWGIEDSCALAHGYLRALSLAAGGDDVVRFEVTDRKTRRTVPVALPCTSQAFVAADIKKRLRELKQLHTTNHVR